MNIIIIIIINEYPEAGPTASICVQHIYYGYELQQQLY